jgi:GNAT superfamily N-acetyltransferase
VSAVSEELEIREWRPGLDDEPLRALLNQAFGLARDAAFFAWKYRENPAGRARIALALVDGRPVSMACVIPRRMRIGGRDVLGSQSVDIATLPAFRGRGLYTRLARHLFEELAAAGFACTYGFTNRLSTRLTLEALGRERVGALPLRVRVLAPLRALAELVRRRPSARATPEPPVAPGVRALFAFDARFDALWDALSPRVDVACVRDARYLRWRYLARPDARYEILAAESEQGALEAYLVWRAVERSGVRAAFVLECVAAPERPRAARRLLAAFARRARASGASLAALLASPGDPAHAELARFARLRVPERLFPQETVLSVISHRAELPTPALAVPRRWWIAWGDSDVV